MEPKTFDAIVIGSGLGGLTAAALMAKAGRNVCVLERNHSLGGAASVFKVGSLTIEASLHQTADPRDPREPKHRILRELGLLDEIEWVPVSPFLQVRGGPMGEPFDLPHGFDSARQALATRFPAAETAIDHLLGTMRKVHGGVAHLTQARAEHSLPKLARGALELRSLLWDWRASLSDVLARQFGDNEALKFALAGNLGYYADDPKRLWWLFFAVTQGAYLASGGVYIKGGSRNLSLKLARIVTKSGGTVRLGREAASIDINGGAHVVRHVDAKSHGGEESVEAQLIFANCAPNVVADMLSEPLRGKLDAAYGGRPLSTSLFSAHFGLRESPSKFGLTRYSTVILPDWLRSFDDFARSSELLGEDPADKLPVIGIANYGALAQCLSATGPTLVSVVGSDRLSHWAKLTPEAERSRRARWLDALKSALDRRYPGFGNAVTEQVFLNARSMQGFLNTPEGAVYGFAPCPPQRPIWAGIPRSPRTPIAGLYLASSFGGGGGFTGAMLAGADAARMALAPQLLG